MKRGYIARHLKGTLFMETAEKKKSGKNQKILIQTGVVIIILFTLMTIAVGNMITMSSFSTALNSNMEMFEYYMDSLGGQFK